MDVLELVYGFLLKDVRVFILWCKDVLAQDVRVCQKVYGFISVHLCTPFFFVECRNTKQGRVRFRQWAPPMAIYLYLNPFIEYE